MILSQPLQTTHLLLRTLQYDDASDVWLSWLNDPKISQFLEIRFANVCSVSELEEFIESANASPDNLLLGIFLKDTGRHIGNIKLGPIVRMHARADLGYLIGDSQCWGKGFATEAIAEVSRYGLEMLDLDKITAGCYDVNQGSAKALLKAGYVHEATIPSHVVFEGQRIASLLYGLNR